MSSQLKWTPSMVVALLEYWDSHKIDFENYEKRKVGYQGAAAYVSEICKVPNLLPIQAENKFGRLKRDRSRNKADIDEFFRAGSSILDAEYLESIYSSHKLKHLKSTPDIQNLHKVSEPSETRTQANSSDVLGLAQLKISEQDTTVDRDNSQLEILLEKKEIENERLRSALGSKDKENEELKLLIRSNGGLGASNSFGSSLNTEGLSDTQIHRHSMELISLLKAIIFDCHDKDLVKCAYVSFHDIEKGNSRLGELVKAIFLVDEETSFSNARSRREFVCPMVEHFLGAVIGAATLRWIFQSDFPNVITENNARADMYEIIIRERDGVVAAKNFQGLAYKMLLEKSSFQADVVPNKAAELTSKMHDVLNHLLDPRGESASPGFWVSILERLSQFFKKALSFFAKLQLNLDDSFIFVWPAPGEAFESEEMQYLQQPELHREEMYIKYTLFPGIVVYDSPDFRKISSGRLASPPERRGDAGIILSKALVLV